MILTKDRPAARAVGRMLMILAANGGRRQGRAVDIRQKANIILS